MVAGAAKMPAHVRNEGTDGGKRHGDAAIALWNFHAATKMGDAARWMPLNKPTDTQGHALDRDWIPA